MVGGERDVLRGGGVLWVGECDCEICDDWRVVKNDRGGGESDSCSSISHHHIRRERLSEKRA